ncbi:putative metalloprotease CJM1_0395 family protein [Dechloromonas sp. ZY10]|uniref:putative metalloprotease CJM1_0395 family protein n=1 Tax=Dechloromonas aquae TaxID=2664436 RepID=UPI003528DECC
MSVAYPVSISLAWPSGVPLAGRASSGSGRGREGVDEAQQLVRLAAVDRKVRAHEQAHQAAGAGLAGSASYQYQRGPDGRQYAVAGEVAISMAPGRTPGETLARAEQVQAAALAPADPSAQDRSVAAQAARMAQEARREQARAEDAGAGTESAARDPFALHGVAAYRQMGGGLVPPAVEAWA